MVFKLSKERKLSNVPRLFQGFGFIGGFTGFHTAGLKNYRNHTLRWFTSVHSFGRDPTIGVGVKRVWRGFHKELCKGCCFKGLGFVGFDFLGFRV